MKQKEIYYADLDPRTKGRKKYTVPVVIISGNVMNDTLEMCIVCPLSDKIKNYPGSVVIKKNKIKNIDRDWEVVNFQVTTIDKSRLGKKIGEITKDELYTVLEGLANVLMW